MVSRMVWHTVYGRVLPFLIVRGKIHLDHIDQGREEPPVHSDRGHLD